LKWTPDTAAKCAPEDSTHPFISQQKVLCFQKQDFEQMQKKQGRTAPVDVSDDSGDEWCGDDNDNGPASLRLYLVSESFKRKEEDMLNQQREEPISEGINLNPAMHVEWLQ
jgi:hypothetical protein